MKLISTFLAVLLACQAASPPIPTFEARRDYYVVLENWLDVADANGDGVPDIITTGCGAVRVLFGSGNGTFRQGPKTLTGMQGGCIGVAADTNGDGRADLVFAGSFANAQVPAGIGVSLGNGDGTFQTAAVYPAGTDAYIDWPVVGDFNGDGIPDAATIGESGVWVFLGKGGGVLDPGVLVPFPGPGNGEILAADFNHDGKLDLVVTQHNPGVGSKGGFAIFLGNGDGTFQSPEVVITPTEPGFMAVGDVNNDGYPDIVLTQDSGVQDSYVYLYLGNGTGGFSGPSYVYLPGGSQLAIADVNGDGNPDLINGAVNIAFGNGKGQFKEPVYYPVQAGTGQPVPASLRAKGVTDLAVGGPNSVSVLLSEGKGKFQNAEWTSVTGGAGCGAAADFNGDGKPDLAVNTSQGVSVLLGTGKAATPYSLKSTIALPGAGCLLTGDLNGDGIPDLLVPGTGGTSAIAYLGNGDGTFTQKSTTSIPTGSYLALGDFNHNGKLDFATSGNLLALGNGDGTFQTPVPFVTSPPPTGFYNIGAADLNNDRWTDVVLTNLFDGYMYVLTNNQQGGFTQTVITGGSFNQVIFDDLNGDGDLDAVVGLGGDGGVSVYLGNGQGGLTFKETLRNLLNIQGPIIVADVNGDGIPDIGLMEGATLALFLGKGDGTFSASPAYFGGGPAPGFLLAQNLHGQSPTAGLPDIVEPDGELGVVVLLNTTK
ncbi:MAG: VCBS repeat-containing protein [Bryobacteraceae bacterium]